MRGFLIWGPSACCMRAQKEALGSHNVVEGDPETAEEFPMTRRISQQFPVILTPSEQVSEQARGLPPALQQTTLTCSYAAALMSLAYVPTCMGRAM